MGRPKGIFSKIADEIGISRTSVRRALAEAGLSEQEAEQDFERAVEIARTFNDKDKTLGHAANGRGEGGTSSDYTAARAELDRERVEKMRIQNGKLRGSLISREAVTQTGIRLIAEVRTALLSLGPRIADKAVGKTDTKDIARIVTQEVRDVLGVLSDSDRFLAALEAEALS
ncbi:hypothetical protein [Bradyrhizobium sp. DASA03120]|uniref:hypothetical protein n=1 Tax=Bradyrhizobium sp. SMVTL-02 TaxID=3395917 RepID=UPI003F71D6FF